MSSVESPSLTLRVGFETASRSPVAKDLADGGTGHCLGESAKPVGWDQRRFAAPAHHERATYPVGGPALELSWSHPTLKDVRNAVAIASRRSEAG